MTIGTMGGRGAVATGVRAVVVGSLVSGGVDIWGGSDVFIGAGCNGSTALVGVETGVGPGLGTASTGISVEGN